MKMYGYSFQREEDLMHYGLKGMHWGTRRWQNEDGTFNAAGKERYFGKGSGENYHPIKGGSSNTKSRTGEISKSSKGMSDQTKAKLKTAAKIGAAVAGTALVAYGGYKLNQLANNQLTREYMSEGMKHLDFSKDFERHASENRQRSYIKTIKGDMEGGKVYGRYAKKDQATANKLRETADYYINRANEGKYSTSEKVDALKRLARSQISR